MEPQEKAETKESVIRSEVLLVENNIDITAQRLESLLNRLQPICLKPKGIAEQAAQQEKDFTDESPLANELAGIRRKSEIIIFNMDDLLRRIQC